MIHINVSKRHLAAVTDEPLVAKTVGVVDFEAAFDPEWEDYEKYIVFAMAGGKGVPVLYAGGTATVPAQALDKSGHLRISAVGLAEGRRDVTAMMMEPLYVNRNGDLGEDPPPAEQSPTLLQQAVLAAARSAAEAREAVEEAKKLLGGGTPEGPAKPGKDGGYYTPKVTQPSDDTMRIAFEPSDEDMPTVNPTEVKLPAGKTPEKGVDYFTQEDKQELVEDVLAEVDIPEDGRSPAITILENGNWAIDGVDTGKPSRGENGTGVEPGATSWN